MSLLVPLLPVLGIIAMTVLSAQMQARALRRQAMALDHPALGAVLARLARALDLPRIGVDVLPMAELNGFAAPDGRVYITRGFLDRLDQGEITPPEIAGVVAHELGHVALGHGRTRQMQIVLSQGLEAGLRTAGARLIPGLGAILGHWAGRGVTLMVAGGLSRRNELDADRYAAAAMTKAGFTIAPQVSLLRTLDAERQARGATPPPAWMASHPPAESRIAALEQIARRWDTTCLPS